MALTNFWRTASNLTIDINTLGQDGCRASANFWAVSQAVSLGRVDVTGGILSLMDDCTAGPQFASGGYIGDSRTGFVIDGSQQQWLTRNSSTGGWYGERGRTVLFHNERPYDPPNQAAWQHDGILGAAAY